MITSEQASTLTGRQLYDRDGEKVGKIGEVWADAAGNPAWASVNTGFFGLHESLVPVQDAQITGDGVYVTYAKQEIKDAPNVDINKDEPLSSDEVQRLYTHYGLRWDDDNRAYQAGSAAGTAAYAGGSGTDQEYADQRTGTVPAQDSGTARDDAMTRSEERLNVGTQQERVGRARLRKYVVTEQQQVQVPVSREEVRLEREPITDANRGTALDGPDISEAEHEVTLHAEQPVVETEAVPVERVRLGKETVTEQQTVGGEVRKERIETDLPGKDNSDLG